MVGSRLGSRGDAKRQIHRTRSCGRGGHQDDGSDAQNPSRDAADHFRSDQDKHSDRNRDAYQPVDTTNILDHRIDPEEEKNVSAAATPAIYQCRRSV